MRSHSAVESVIEDLHMSYWYPHIFNPAFPIQKSLPSRLQHLNFELGMTIAWRAGARHHSAVHLNVRFWPFENKSHCAQASIKHHKVKTMNQLPLWSELI